MLTEVPGWPGATRGTRFLRTLPVVFPCALILLLAGWSFAVAEPRIRNDRVARRPLLALERDIASLRSSYSDHEARDLAGSAAQLSRSLISGPAEAEPVLADLKRSALELHWVGDFKAAQACSAVAGAGQVAYLPVRVALASASDNQQPFPTLLAFLDRVPAFGKRADLTRLLIHADEDGRYSVLADLRLACRVDR